MTKTLLIARQNKLFIDSEIRCKCGHVSTFLKTGRGKIFVRFPRKRGCKDHEYNYVQKC